MSNRIRFRLLRDRFGSDNVMVVVGIILATIMTFVFNYLFTYEASKTYVFGNSETGSVFYEMPLTWAIYVLCIVFMIVLYVTRFVTNKLAYRNLDRVCDKGVEIDRRYDKENRDKMFILDITAVLLFFVAHLFAVGMEEIMIFVYGPIYMAILSVGFSVLALRVDKMNHVVSKGASRWKSWLSFLMNWLVAALFTCVLLEFVELADWNILFILVDVCALITVTIFMWKVKDKQNRVDVFERE